MRASSSFAVSALVIALSAAPVRAESAALVEVSGGEMIDAIASLSIGDVGVAVEAPEASAEEWSSATPVGRGIISRKGRMMNLFCLERDAQSNCVRGQYGILKEGGDGKRDSLGNLMGVFAPIGPVLSVHSASEMRAAITGIPDGRWKLPKLGFRLTKKAWSRESGYRDFIALDDSFVGGGLLFGGLSALATVPFAGLFIASAPALVAVGAATVTLVFTGPTLADLGINAGKALLTPFVAVQRGIRSLAVPNYAKIADAMTARDFKNWQIRPLRVSEKTFKRVEKTIRGDLPSPESRREFDSFR